MNRAKGLIVEEKLAGKGPFVPQLIGGVAEPWEVYSLRHLFHKRQDQMGRQICVACDVHQQIWVQSGEQLGLNVDLSVRAAYYIGRARSAGAISKQSGWRPVDIGSKVSDVWMALSEFGWAPTSAAPLTPFNVDDPIPWNAYRKGWGSPWIDFYTINETGPACNLLVKQAVASGRPVGCAFFIDEALERWMPGMPPWNGVQGSTVGKPGHMMTIGAYDALGVWAHSAWPGWGLEQFAHLSWQALSSDSCLALIVAEFNWRDMPKPITGKMVELK